MKTLLTVAITSHLIPTSEPCTLAEWRSDVRGWVEERGEEGFAGILEIAKSEDPLLAEKLSRRARDWDLFLQALEQLRESGIFVVSEFDEAYPERFFRTLGEARPPVLFWAGEEALLNARTVGIVGSRDVDEVGSEFAEAVARVAVESGYAVVSGGARGVDRTAMNAALDAGGASLGFLADSLEATVRKSREPLESGALCLATPYAPAARFSIGNAMGRNKLIYGHADVTVVVSATEGSGGTWAGAMEAVKKGYGSVAVRDGAGAPPGNRALLEALSDGMQQDLFAEGTPRVSAICKPEDLFALLSRAERAV